MKEEFEKIKERLEKKAVNAAHDYNYRGAEAYTKAIEIVNLVAEEYNQSLTNADKIRSMTDEELADFLSVNAFCDCCSIHDKCDAYQEDSCKNVFIKWLQSKAEE